MPNAALQYVMSEHNSTAYQKFVKPLQGIWNSGFSKDLKQEIANTFPRRNYVFEHWVKEVL